MSHSTFGASSFANRRFQEYETEKERNDNIVSQHQHSRLLTSNNHQHYNYVSMEEFALFKKSIERDRSYRDEIIFNLKKELAEVKQQQRDNNNMTSSNDDNHGGDHQTHHQQKQQNSSSSSVLMSSPPKRYGIFGNQKSSSKSSQPNAGNNHSDTTTASSSPEEQLSHHLTLQSRIEHLESVHLSLPSQLEAVEEKCRTIVDERMRKIHHASQLENLLNKIDSLSDKQESMQNVQIDISNMLEHDVARNAPIKQSLDEVRLDAALLKKEVDTLHSQRLASEDVRVKLENEVRALRTHVAELETMLSGKLELEVAKLGSTRESLTENLVDRKLSIERDAFKDFVRREIHRVREENLDAQNQMRVEMMASASSTTPNRSSVYNTSIPSVQSVLTNSHHQNNNNNNQNTSTISNISSHQQQEIVSDQQQQQELLVESSSGLQQKLFNLLSEQVQSKGRQIEANLNVTLGDANRSIESKLATRIREQAEANRALLSEELSKHLDEQFRYILNTAKEEMRHELSQQIEGAMKRESEKLLRNVLQQSNSQTSDQLRRHQDEVLRIVENTVSNSSRQQQQQHQQQQQTQPVNNNQNNNTSITNEGAPDVILDGVELFVREALGAKNPFISNNNNNEQRQLLGQCLDLVSECRTRNEYSNKSTTSVHDALLLLWKFLRSHLASFNVLTESVAQSLEDVVQQQKEQEQQQVQQQQQQQQNNNNHNLTQTGMSLLNENDQRILNTVFDDLDVVVTQFTQVNDSFNSCGELLDQVSDDIRLQEERQKTLQQQQLTGGVGHAQLTQLIWMFIRGLLSLFTMMGERIDRVDEQQQQILLMMNGEDQDQDQEQQQPHR